MAIYSSGGGNGAAATLKSLATPGSSTMAGDTWWPIYRAYWNSDNYADEFVTNTDDLPAAMRKELIKKGSVYQGVWMHAVHNFDQGKRECDVVLWDKGMAYYVGSLEGEYETSADIASDGNLTRIPGDRNVENFGTCERSTDKTTFAAVNSEIQSADGFAVQGKNLLCNRHVSAAARNASGLGLLWRSRAAFVSPDDGRRARPGPARRSPGRRMLPAQMEASRHGQASANTDADAVAANDDAANRRRLRERAWPRGLGLRRGRAPADRPVRLGGRRDGPRQPRRRCIRTDEGRRWRREPVEGRRPEATAPCAP